LVLAGESFDGPAVLADIREPAVHVSIGAQDVGEHGGVPGIGLSSGLAVPFTVTGHRPGINRVHREPRVGQCDNEQVLIGLDRDRRIGGSPAMLGDERQQRGESFSARVNSGATDYLALLVDQGDLMM